MKARSKRVFIGIVLVVLTITSFFAGSFVAEQKHNRVRKERCNMLVMFAIDRIEGNNFESPEDMTQLISDVFAAYHYCDDAESKSDLHVVWQRLVFKADDIDATKKYALRKLNDVLSSMG